MRGADISKRKLDRIDRSILRTLQVDGRMTNSDLARSVNLSATPCLERVRRLERDGYIEGYHARLNAEKMRAGFMTFVTVKLDQTNENIFEDFKRAVHSIDEIVECHMVGGGFDYILKIRTDTMGDYRQLMEARISGITAIASTSSYFVMEEVKSTRFYRVPED